VVVLPTPPFWLNTAITAIQNSSQETSSNPLIQDDHFMPLSFRLEAGATHDAAMFRGGSFHRHRFGQITWLIDVGAFEHGDMVGQ